MKNLNRIWIALSIATALSAPATAQQIRVDGDDFVMTGCVSRMDAAAIMPGSVLAWSRNDLMLNRAIVAGNPIGTSGVAPGGVLYYLDKNDDLMKHLGQLVEVKGDLKDIDKGSIKIDRDGAFTEVTLKIDDREDKVRVPTGWFGTDVKDRKYDIIARKLDVDDVKVLGVCPVR